MEGGSAVDSRKRQILAAIIEDYINTAEPVGSRTLSRHHALGVSPATIRNEMADLEELGYLEQPHTSAGRIPSQLGYRYYVDALMTMEPPQGEEVRSLSDRLRARITSSNFIFAQTAQLLSDVTHLTAIVLGPKTGGA
jgi:heat-inducible transcriptional repressor